MRHATTSAALRTRFEIWVGRHGCAWPLAAVVAAAALVGAWLLDPARKELAQSELQLRASHARASTQSRVPTLSDEDTRLAALRSALPPSRPAAIVVGQLAELAQAERIEVVRAEYLQTSHPSIQLQQLQMIQPVRADYPQIKRYIDAVLLAMPSASLDQISVRRENVGQAQLEVRLRWSFWSRSPGPAPVSSTGEGRP